MYKNYLTCGLSDTPNKMKLYISTLLLAFTVILHSGKGNQGPICRVVRYKEHRVKLWLDENETRVIGADMDDRERHPIAYFSDMHYLMRIVKVGSLKFIAHILKDGSLYAVEPPPLSGTYRSNEPTDTKWFITCNGSRVLQLTVDYAERPIEIHYLPENENHVGIEPELTRVDDIEFYAYKNRRGKIIAASLPPQQHNPQRRGN